MAAAVVSDMGVCLTVAIVSDEVVLLYAGTRGGRGDPDEALKLRERLPILVTTAVHRLHGA